MIIFPAIDIYNGNCVRLIKGEFESTHKVAEDPVETGLSFKEQGAEFIHMVDLNGAVEGKRPNRDIFIKVANATNLKVEVGGGIRNLDAVEDYLNSGIERVILGSSALKDIEFVKEAVLLYPDRIAVGIDAKDGKVSTDGWLRTSQTDYLEFAKRMEGIGVKYINFTDISKDGTLLGPNFEQLSNLKSTVSCNIVASGGIKDIENIRGLTKMGLYGAICGKSIYSGTLDLKEAIEVAKGVK